MRAKMTFKIYLAYVGMTIKEMAQVLDCSPGYLQAVVTGQRQPSRRFNRDIIKATDGMVNVLESESSAEIEIVSKQAA